MLSKDAAAIEPGKYTVVLEPAALGDLLAFLIFSADARQADEEELLLEEGGGNRIGEQVLGEKVNIYSDPSHPLAPSVMFDGGGLPIKRTSWVQGVLEGSDLLAVLGAEAESEPTGAGESDHGRRQRDDGGSDCRHRARRAGHPLLATSGRSIRRPCSSPA